MASNESTIRYSGNQDSEFKNSIETTYQFGCEYEFYISEEHNFEQVIFEITQSIYEISDADMLIDFSYLPIDEDKNYCFQIKSDGSLKSNGVEITIPITSRIGFVRYLERICNLIKQYGYTNRDTGLHIHISTVDSNGINFNFYKYMLLCDEEQLLSSWETREGYSHNVMDILSQNTKLEAKKIKTDKGTIWNLEKILPNHIEIKSIGGIDYHLDTQRLIHEFNLYADLFQETLEKDSEKHLALYKKHKAHINSVSSEKQKQFMVAIEDAGIIEKRGVDDPSSSSSKKHWKP